MASNTRIAEIETLLDRFYESGYKKGFSVAEYLRVCGCTAREAEVVAGYYRPLLDEANELAGGEPQLREAYKNLDRLQISRFVAQVQTIVSEAEDFAGTLKAGKPRKQRARKEKSAEQLTSKLACMPECQELGLVGVEPARIIGAKTVYLYSIRYKTLQVLHAGPDGLSVSGSTIKGFSEASFAKRVRHPDKFLRALVGAGWQSAVDMAAALRTKTLEPTGRSNPETVIIRVVRQSG
jgi:hypothetical protein